jgi:hypothetical protein
MGSDLLTGVSTAHEEIARPGRDMYLNCSRCGLSLHTSRFAHLEPEHCPRCLARARVLHPLFRSPMTVRALSPPIDEGRSAPMGVEPASPDPDAA